MVDVFKNKLTAAAKVNSTERSRNGGRMRRRKQYQMNPEDDQLVQQPASHESPVSIDPPLSPRQVRSSSFFLGLISVYYLMFRGFQHLVHQVFFIP